MSAHTKPSKTRRSAAFCNSLWLVAGWSASLGHDWNQAWMSGSFASSGYFGLSMLGVGAAGGPAGGVPAPALPLFSFGTSIMNGWNLEPVPEPSAALVMLRRLRETGSHKGIGEL